MVMSAMNRRRVSMAGVFMVVGSLCRKFRMGWFDPCNPPGESGGVLTLDGGKTNLIRPLIRSEVADLPRYFEKS